MRERSHHRFFETSKGNVTTDSGNPAITLGCPWQDLGTERLLAALNPALGAAVSGRI